MPVDELGRRAARDLRAAVAGLDENAALVSVTSPGRKHSMGTRLVVVCVAAALLVVAAATLRAQLSPGSTVSPAGDLAGAIVGQGLSVPLEFTVPEGWDATTNGAFLQLSPVDGSDRLITVTPAGRTFDPPTYTSPPSYATLSKPADYVLWTLTHPALEVRNRFGGYGEGYDTSQMDLLLTGSNAASSPDSARVFVPLVPLPGVPDRITISDDDETFRWIVVSTRDGIVLVAAQSATPRDTALWDGINELVQSLKIVPPSRD